MFKFLTENRYPVHRFWWLCAPLLLLVAVAVINPFLSKEHGTAWMYAENGFLETLQWIIALGAAGLGLACLRFCKGRPWIALWVLLGTLGCLYIGLEEISYGQHIFKWETPEHWQAVNDQNETNLHNTSSWLDQKPRLLLFIGVIMGGLVLPFVRHLRPQLLPARFAAIYPCDALFWTALCAVLSHAAKWARKLGIAGIYHRPSEMNEVFVYYFVFLYLLLMFMTLRAAHKTKA